MTLATLFAEVDISRGSAWLILIGGVCSAVVSVAAFWRKVLRPLAAFTATVDAYFPVMVSIAKHYTDNQGGDTLAGELSALTSNQETIAENQQLIANRLEDLNVKLDELHVYSHSMRHDIIGDVARLSVTLGTTGTLVDALVAVATELRLVNRQLTPSTESAPPAPDNR